MKSVRELLRAMAPLPNGEGWEQPSFERYDVDTPQVREIAAVIEDAIRTGAACPPPAFAAATPYASSSGDPDRGGSAA